VKKGTVTVAGKESVTLPHDTVSSGAFVPDLPGCVAAAKTREETVKLIRESIPMHIASLVANGEPVPPPAAQVERVTVAA
jgi:predicted RNase H-like HicB family nuclease